MGVNTNKKNRILTLIKDSEIRNDLSFPKGFQFQVIQGMVYSNGFPIQSELQEVFMKWINENPKLFKQTLNF